MQTIEKSFGKILENADTNTCGKNMPEHGINCDGDYSDNLKTIFSYSNSDVVSYRAFCRAISLCNEYLGGVWNNVQLSDVRVEPVKGGMSNLLLRVELSGDIKPIANEPTTVILRILSNEESDTIMNDQIVFTILSERKIGPKLFGCFSGGRFEEYIPSRCLKTEEIRHPEISRCIGRLLARIHASDIPIKKHAFFVQRARAWLTSLCDSGVSQQMNDGTLKYDVAMVPQEITWELLRDELDFAVEFTERSNSPMRFCHNDLQEGNILLKATANKACEHWKEITVDSLKFIDFEYAGYNYRGFDLANHLCEYMFDYTNQEKPYYTVNKECFANEEQQKRFLSAYLNELKTLDDSQQDEATEKLVQEVKHFVPVAHLFWSIWSFMHSKISSIGFDYNAYGVDRLLLYFETKKFIKD